MMKEEWRKRVVMKREGERERESDVVEVCKRR